jgi:hypothetical protein
MKARIVCLMLLLLCLIAMAAAPNKLDTAVFSAAASPQGDQAPIRESAAQQIRALMAEKESRTPAQRKIDSQLLYAMKIRRGDQIVSAVPALQSGVTLSPDNKVVVDITGTLGGNLIENIYSLGGEILTVVPGYNSIRANVPIDQLEAIAAMPEVIFVQPKQEATTRRFDGISPGSSTRQTAGFAERAARVRNFLETELAPAPSILPLVGSRQSEGDTTHKAALARATLGTNGTGVKIGVLSDGVTSLLFSQASGDLGPVTVLPGQTGGGDEGTAMLEIVHDLAPGAQLFFATAFNGITSFAQNIRDLRTAGCDIIIDDVIYFAETPFQDGQAPGVISPRNGGVVIQAVNDVTAAGALYFSSAGNDGNLDDGTATNWEGDFKDGGTLSGLVGGHVHDFGGGVQSDLITITAGGPIVLHWSDPLGGSTNDYDLFVLSGDLTTVLASSTNFQTGTQDPFEQISVSQAIMGNRIVILQKTGAAVRGLHLTAFEGRLSQVTAGVTTGHSEAANAFSVGATPAQSPGPFPGFFNSGNHTETFSSDGPRRFFYNANGSPITPGNILFATNGGLLRSKPDITAADGVSVTGVGGFPSTFFGTSAAAPHAGAIAGLLKAANPAATNAQIRTALVSSAIDIEAPGADRDSGAGIVMAFEALQALGISPQASVDLGTVTATESGGNGNTFIEPGESGQLSIVLSNSGVVAASGINATLTTTTPGVTIGNGVSAYPDLSAGTGSALNAVPFTFSIAGNAPCDLNVLFTMSITYSGGTSPKVFSFNVQTGLPQIVINSTLDGTAPSPGPAFTASTGLQTARLNRNGVVSACGAPKVFPNTTGAGTRRFDAYQFTACPTVTSQCVRVTLTSNTGNNTLITAAYTTSFDPNNLSTNYIADAGFSGPTGVPLVYSFDVTGGMTFIIVVNEVDSGGGIGNNYTLTVSGACSTCICPVTIDQPGGNFLTAGGSGMIQVTADPGCVWAALSTGNFVTIAAGAGGTGNGMVGFNVAANNGARRTATININNQVFQVKQSANFADVDPGNIFAPFIQKVSAAGITVGCGQDAQGHPLYCPSDPVLRDQMAAFIIRALGQPNPPMPASQRFMDVPPSSPFYAFVDQMAIRGITVGCNPPSQTLYCPGANVLREQMAAFLIRALGMPNPPMPLMQRFVDVPPSNLFYAFIDQMAVRGITQGCNPPTQDMYCPAGIVTRDQMAAFIVRAFGL